MNYKTRMMFAISLAAIFSVSLVSIGDMPQAIADQDKHDDEPKKYSFSKKPSFVSKECIVRADNLPGDVPPLPEDFIAGLDCEMKAWLDKKGTGLKYKIQITGMELIDSNTDHHTPDGVLDDIDGAHIHKMTNDDVTNPTGPHQLNTFGNPGFDDSDVVVKPVQGIIKGIWDDGDKNTSYGHPNDSHTLTENLGLLCEGKIFSAVHGEVEDRPGHKAPYVKMILEPTKQGNKICDKLGY